ncbi:MAG: peptidoglycan editing factor PgeF [Thermoanaerobaculia bacterium]
MRDESAGTGHRLWRDRLGAVEVRFVGRGPGDRTAAAAAARAPRQIAWSRQVHSARVLDAAPGACGEGDALITRRTGLALSVVTADCVPILLAGSGEVASIHAGWRGIAAGIVTETLDRLDSPAAHLTAWLGPAIGPCCYEVGDDVASRVAAASDTATLRRGRRARPHLDLHHAVTSQLTRTGVRQIHRVPDCTHCSSGTLWSYRREGPGAGRNLAFIWIES